MSGEMDKFVLQYSVEMKEAIARLEQLDRKVTDTNKKTKESTSEFKKFGQDAATEIGRLIPGIDKVTAAIGGMGTAFSVAAVAIGALAVGVKSVMSVRDQFGAQRLLGMETGVSGMRLEELQRKFVKNSGGTVSRDMAGSQLEGITKRIQSAYVNLDPFSQERKQLAAAGVNPGKLGGPKTDTMTALKQMGEHFATMTPDKVQGIAQAIGMSQDFALTLRKLGGSIGDVTELTAEDIEKRASAEGSLKEFNKELAKLQESFTELEVSLGQFLLPAFTKLIEFITKVVDVINSADKGPKGAKKTIAEEMRNRHHNSYDPVEDRPATKEEEAKKQEDKEKDKKTAKQLLEAADEENRKASEYSAKMEQAINMFAGAVATFSNAIDEKQAWAAWAGEVGRAGLSQSVNSQGQVNPGYIAPKQAATAFDPIFDKYAKESGIPVNVLKSIAKTESSFNPNAVGKQTKYGKAQGLMQVLQSNAPGVDLLDPENNIREGTKVYKKFLERAGGDHVKALTYYHGGTDPKNWGPETAAYPGKVLGQVNKVNGQGRTDTQLRNIQVEIAKKLGVSLGNLQTGDVNKEDTAWAAMQLGRGYNNQAFNLRKDLQKPNLPEGEKSRLQNALREQESGMRQLKQFAPQIVNQQKGMGPPVITMNERAIQINVNGVQDPDKVTQMVSGHLEANLADMLQSTLDGMKY